MGAYSGWGGLGEKKGAQAQLRRDSQEDAAGHRRRRARPDPRILHAGAHLQRGGACSHAATSPRWPPRQGHHRVARTDRGHRAVRPDHGGPRLRDSSAGTPSSTATSRRRFCAPCARSSTSSRARSSNGLPRTMTSGAGVSSSSLPTRPTAPAARPCMTTPSPEYAGYTQSWEYFLRRGLDLLAKDGIGVYLIPSGFMSGTSSVDLRGAVLLRHHLMCAYRLPSSVFPQARVTVDLIFFRSRGGKLLAVDDADKSILEGNYFVENPTHVLGTVNPRGRYGGGYEILGDFQGLPEFYERPVCTTCVHAPHRSRGAAGAETEVSRGCPGRQRGSAQGGLQPRQPAGRLPQRRICTEERDALPGLAGIARCPRRLVGDLRASVGGQGPPETRQRGQGHRSPEVPDGLRARVDGACSWAAEAADVGAGVPGGAGRCGGVGPAPLQAAPLPRRLRGRGRRSTRSSKPAGARTARRARPARGLLHRRPLGEVRPGERARGRW